MAPNWVCKPVATIRQRAVPLRTLVPRKTQFNRSRKPAVRRDGAWPLFDRKALAGQDRFADEEVGRLENHAVGRNQAAGRQQHHVARHDLFRRHIDRLPVAKDAGPCPHARLQGRRRRLGVVLARVADAHRREHDHDDDDGIHPLAGHRRCHRGEDQHQQQRVPDLIHQHPRARQAPVLAHLVRSVLAQSSRSFRSGQAVMCRAESVHQRVGVGIPIVLRDGIRHSGGGLEYPNAFDLPGRCLADQLIGSRTAGFPAPGPLRTAMPVSDPRQRSLSDLVVEDDRIVLLRRHGALDERPHALMARRGDPLLAKLLALELQLEAVVVIRRARVPCTIARRLSIFTRM